MESENENEVTLVDEDFIEKQLSDDDCVPWDLEDRLYEQLRDTQIISGRRKKIRPLKKS